MGASLLKRKHLASHWFFIVFVAVLATGLTFFARPELARDWILPPKVKVGDKGPPFALTSAQGKTIRLSDFAGHNVLIDFYRGYWWPCCMIELGELVKHYQEFKALDVQVDRGEIENVLSDSFRRPPGSNETLRHPLAGTPQSPGREHQRANPGAD